MHDFRFSGCRTWKNRMTSVAKDAFLLPTKFIHHNSSHNLQFVTYYFVFFFFSFHTLFPFISCAWQWNIVKICLSAIKLSELLTSMSTFVVIRSINQFRLNASAQMDIKNEQPTRMCMNRNDSKNISLNELEYGASEDEYKMWKKKSDSKIVSLETEATLTQHSKPIPTRIIGWNHNKNRAVSTHRSIHSTFQCWNYRTQCAYRERDESLFASNWTGKTLERNGLRVYFCSLEKSIWTSFCNLKRAETTSFIFVPQHLFLILDVEFKNFIM